jgi:hypothetical protein
MSLPSSAHQAPGPQGLSKLQRAILKLAIANVRHDAGQNHAVSRREVLEAYYGFRPVRLGRCRSSPVFSRGQIGLSRYRAAQVSLSKAVKRLAARGLLNQSPKGLVLTEAGVIAARQLAAANG